MRVLASVLVLLAGSTACAGAQTLRAEVEYSFVDQNGLGWVTLDGEVTVTLTFDGEQGSLKVSGKRRWVEAVLIDGASPEASPELDTSIQGEGYFDETFPLHDVRRTGTTITFELDPGHDHLTGSCAPTTIPELARTGLYECTIDGFEWHAIAELPELHHPIVLDADVQAKTPIVNSMTGSTRRNFGQRVVRDASVSGSQG